MKNARPRGFTLVELLVVIAIIGVFAAMMIPAVQASRETGRRSLCQANMAQILLAAMNYENAFESFPAGVINPDGPIRSEAAGLHQGWLIQMLPYVDQRVAYEAVKTSTSVYDPANAEIRKFWPSMFLCPSEPNDVPGAASYAGCHHDVEAPIAADNHGILFLNSHVRREDIPDGASSTLLIAEKAVEQGDLGWMSGTRASLRNTGHMPNERAQLLAVNPAEQAAENAPAAVSLVYVGGFGSAHPGGLHIGLADGSVRFVSELIEPAVWGQLGHRSDGKLLGPYFREE